MRKAALSLTMLATLALPTLLTTPAQAVLPSKTWVAGYGTDGNPCSFGSPCATLQSAHDKTAPGGEIGVIGSGDYGPLTISKSISIVAEGGEASILTSSFDGILVNAGASDVIHLRGLTIDGNGGGGYGISFRLGAALHVERCVIKNFKSSQAGWGIGVFSNNPSEIFVSDSVVINNGSAGGGGGIWISPEVAVPVRVVLNRIEANDNFRGIKADGTGVSGSIMNINVRDSVASGNANNGIVSTTSSGGGTILMTLDRVTSSNNGASAPASVGVVSDGPTSFIRIGASTVTGNWNGLSFSNGGQLISFGDNKVIGNSNDGSPSSIATPK